MQLSVVENLDRDAVTETLELHDGRVREGPDGVLASQRHRRVREPLRQSLLRLAAFETAPQCHEVESLDVGDRQHRHGSAHGGAALRLTP